MPEASRRAGGRVLAVTVTVAALVAGCSRPVATIEPVASERSKAESTRFAAALSAQVTGDRMMMHMSRLQEIADANGGNRAAGTPGYDASVDYVATVLRDAGFEVTTPQFEVRLFEAEKPVLTVGGTQIDAAPLRFTVGTEGLSGRLVVAPSEETPGCVPADYQGLDVKGAVVLVDRGGCRFTEKLAILSRLGAAAMIVANNVDEEVMPGSLLDTNTLTVPAVSVSKSAGARMRDQPGTVTLTLDARTRTVTSRNVLAQTRTGSTSDVVMAGAHLDTVPEGAGANDNASGVAAVLETARQLGSSPAVNHAVRFGFWGAEEVGLVGARKYIESLDLEGLKDIALYLNFDMIAASNAGYFTYDGNQSTAPAAGESVPRVPEGSAGIERTLMAYLQAAGKPAEDTSFDGRSDYAAFTAAGIPAGGLFAGGEEKKTAEQARLWGGTADEPFSPEYHTDADNLDRISREALAIQGAGVGYAVGLYALSMDGRNGIPLREDRTRTVATAS